MSESCCSTPGIAFQFLLQVDEKSWNKAVRAQYRWKLPIPLPKLLDAPFKKYAPLVPPMVLCLMRAFLRVLQVFSPVLIVLRVSYPDRVAPSNAAAYSCVTREQLIPPAVLQPHIWVLKNMVFFCSLCEAVGIPLSKGLAFVERWEAEEGEAWSEAAAEEAALRLHAADVDVIGEDRPEMDITPLMVAPDEVLDVAEEDEALPGVVS